MSFEKMLERFQSKALRPKQFETHYEGESRLDALGISLPPSARVLEIQAPFAKMAIDVLTEVLIPSGFILPDQDRDDDIALIRETWQYNNMDSQFNLAAAEAIAAGLVFWVLAPPDKDHEYATIRAIDAKHGRVRIDYSGKPIEGIARYRLPNGKQGASYYTPDGVTMYEENQSGWVKVAGRKDKWGMSIVPMFNRARISDRYGRSDLKELRTVIDAASRTLTNLQIAQEVSALPMRALVGDGAGEVVKKYADRMQAYMGTLLALPEGASVTQVSGAPLDPFISSYRSYALQISAMTGIPPSMMGVASDNNPTSAEALRVAKDRLIARAENKQRQFSDALEEVGRLIVTMNGGSLEGLQDLEVTWRDAAAPSVSAQMQAALQAQAQGVIHEETAREYMRLTPAQMEREAQLSRDIHDMTGMSLGEREEGEPGAGEDLPADAQQHQGVVQAKHFADGKGAF